jgi:hypothetical protein
MNNNAEYQKKWYQKNKAIQIARNEQNKKNKKEKIKKYKEERGCSRCGEKHISCLQFHHKNPNEKESDINSLIKRNLSIEKIMIEIEKCEVICANCHFKHHWNGRLDKQE